MQDIGTCSWGTWLPRRPFFRTFVAGLGVSHVATMLSIFMGDSLPGTGSPASAFCSPCKQRRALQAREAAESVEDVWAYQQGSGGQSMP
ncbi:hypothetical protein OF83DRAFT_1180185 [Amylostereum chailletii]|nr:hypothetical protein OF83DRAFT_1180185 [Amylostereum chailletii]